MGFASALSSSRTWASFPCSSDPFRSSPFPDHLSLLPSCSTSSSASSSPPSSSVAAATPADPPSFTLRESSLSAASAVTKNGALFDHSFLLDEDPRQTFRAPPPPPTLHKSFADGLRFGGLDLTTLSYKEKFVIRCYEVGMNRTATLESLANLLQEVACNHAQSVGFSTDGFATTPSMRKLHLIWVTTRMHIEVDEYPVWGDVVELETWCQSEGKVGTRRDWLMTNVATGKIIGRATSTWVMMNQDTRRLSRITEDVREEYTRYCPTVPRYAFSEDDSSSLKKIPKLEDPVHHIKSGLMPRRGDLDMNQHVNNVTYFGWILESIPQDIADTHQLHRITLDYRRECGCCDVVESLASAETCYNVQSDSASILSSANDNGAPASQAVNLPARSADSVEFLHLLRLVGTQTEINRGRTVWRRKAEK